MITSKKHPLFLTETAAFVIATALASASVHAQSAAGSATTDKAQNTDIIVTGSRIARPEATSSVPLAVVSSASIQNVGQTNVLDALRDLPIAGQSEGTTASNFNNFGNGEATINLRNLGKSRTLVLINGIRSVGIPGDSAVDLNNIPTDLIDHVEIVTGGASAIYGSDAVAGVVNIILKNNFKGLELHMQDMITGHGDGNSPLLSALAGTDFAGGAGHIVANFTYTKQDAVPSSARSYSQHDSPIGSAYTPAGTFFPQNNTDAWTFDNNNNVVPQTFSDAQRFNRASDRLLSIPVERYVGSILAHYDVASNAQLYTELTYTKTKASGMIEPLAVDDAGNQGQSAYTFEGSPNFPGIPTVNNPFVPTSIATDAAGANLDFYKRLAGIFDRSPHDDRDYFRGVIGLKGNLSSNWKYDISYEHSQVRDDTYNQAILMTNFGAALQATTNSSGQVVCADPVAAAAGCVPINIFGQPNYTAAQLKWLSTYTGQGVVIPGATPGEQVYADFLQKNYQDVATASITGSLFHLPNGPLGVAAGVEYRREKVSEVFDPFTQSGFSSQQLNGNEFGSISSKEAFVEINAPILGHLPAIYALSFEGAARYANYSTVGGVWTYKYGGTYAPTPDFRFRAIYARAVRAPNLNELYSPLSNTAQQVVDPCDQGQGLGGGSLGSLPAACLAIPGISTYLQTHPNFIYSLQQVETIFGLVGGNQNLQAEATNTFTAGATFTPRFMRNFLLTADYYTIKVKNAIATVDPQTAVNQCFATGSADFCDLVHRNANGFITEVDGVNINAASYLVAGIDIQAVYGIKTHIFNEGEKLNFDFYYNHKFKQQQTPFAGGPISNELGTADTYASQQLGTGFKDQFTLNINFSTGPVSISYRMKYLGPVTASEGSFAIPAYTYHDLQAKISFAKHAQFYIGCNNLFDLQPPFIAGGDSQWPGTNTVADTYDLLGREFYAGIRYKL